MTPFEMGARWVAPFFGWHRFSGGTVLWRLENKILPPWLLISGVESDILAY